MDVYIAHRESKGFDVVHMRTCAREEAQTLPPPSNESVDSHQAHDTASVGVLINKAAPLFFHYE